jgi:glycosyltransferase involved in cell wall biosynthesis
VHDGFFFAWPPKDPAIAVREQKPVRLAAQEADQIITDSHFSKAELIKFLDLPQEKIDVVHLGVDQALLRERQEPAKFENASRYVLFVGELESRKGIDTLLAAAAMLPEALRVDLVVAIAGRLSERPDLHGEPIPPHPDGLRIELLGHVSDERLRSLYAGAAAFIFPSRYEGFGLPVLEAMACGAPVIASDAASIPEAGGEAALYFPVGDAAALAQAMERVFTDAGLADRLRDAGRKRAAAMSWDTTALRTLEVFERVVRQVRGRSARKNTT